MTAHSQLKASPSPSLSATLHRRAEVGRHHVQPVITPKQAHGNQHIGKRARRDPKITTVSNLLHRALCITMSSLHTTLIPAPLYVVGRRKHLR